MVLSDEGIPISLCFKHVKFNAFAVAVQSVFLSSLSLLLYLVLSIPGEQPPVDSTHPDMDPSISTQLYNDIPIPALGKPQRKSNNTQAR